MLKKLILSSFFLMLLVSCKTYNVLEEEQASRNMQDFSYDPNYEYRIRKDDKITLSVWGQDDLSVGSVYGIYNSNEVYGKWLLVDINGNIEIPKLGTTPVVGKSLPELKEEIKTKLKKWLVNPIVDVKVLNKEIAVMGEVRNPAVIQVDKDQNTLLELVSKAGGFEMYANLKSIKILRQEGENVRVTNIDLTKMKDVPNQNILLHPGDYIIVPSKKSKDFDKRISTIIPFATVTSAAAILIGLL
ncbi:MULTISPECIES: polysaccharide biosynthesis/export family protein [Chryseobacterium]|jgi:polysaccharide export outer membrane protein|uniref:Polysaccharide export protein n=3 Tax=Chryseobacterium TaxID=59732 RepID=A0ABM8K5B7_9FLAO|nr:MULTISPECIES: polysaccharide biosynthesis/export family protein [Chryseobacterium]MBL7879243.1 polysaccharide export protein [Chryseobacterium gambrini]MCY1661581.1 polysaccharide export protein [Chryseobacterium sp. SL1]WBV52920.1 polysaccharide export protein [Chryseobacterium gambrini]WBX97064.1 polysaccharide export protein [Chryseobacterium gambrini]BEV02852.1 polysaccharide export protein [Chryseobacterium gambrini]